LQVVRQNADLGIQQVQQSGQYLVGNNNNVMLSNNLQQGQQFLQQSSQQGVQYLSNLNVPRESLVVDGSGRVVRMASDGLSQGLSQGNFVNNLDQGYRQINLSSPASHLQQLPQQIQQQNLSGHVRGVSLSNGNNGLQVIQNVGNQLGQNVQNLNQNVMQPNLSRIVSIDANSGMRVMQQVQQPAQQLIDNNGNYINMVNNNAGQGMRVVQNGMGNMGQGVQYIQQQGQQYLVDNRGVMMNNMQSAGQYVQEGIQQMPVQRVVTVMQDGSVQGQQGVQYVVQQGQQVQQVQRYL
jgi:hypothetical protein